MGREKKTNKFRIIEKTYTTYLNPTLPAIIRVDGRAFSRLTRQMNKPFDALFIELMNHTAQILAENVPECKLAYVQSDEISLLIKTNDPVNCWFNWKKEKIISVVASIATAAFNQKFASLLNESTNYAAYSYEMLPTFDARAFNVPENEIENYFIWRQTDATRNAISQAAYSIIGSKNTKNMSTNEMQEALFQNGINFNDYPTRIKRGAILYRKVVPLMGTNPVTGEQTPCIRHKWLLDDEIPIFTQNTQYLSTMIRHSSR